jgi:hypothetical protein
MGAHRAARCQRPMCLESTHTTRPWARSMALTTFVVSTGSVTVTRVHGNNSTKV